MAATAVIVVAVVEGIVWQVCCDLETLLAYLTSRLWDLLLMSLIFLLVVESRRRAKGERLYLTFVVIICIRYNLKVNR